MRYFGPVFWNGARHDRDGASFELPVRAYLAQLAQRLRAMNQLAGAWTRRLTDGVYVKMHVILSGVVPIYAVDIIDERFTEFNLVSGLFEGRSSDPVGDGYFRDVVLVKWNGSSFYRTGWEQNTDVLDSLMTDDPALSPCTQTGLSGWQGPESAYSGMWTGEMSKVVQLLLGMGAKVPYAHCATRTHGIWIGSDGSRWVVEVDTTTGITAWELAVQGPSFEAALSYDPVPMETLPDLADRITLAPAAELSAYDGYTKLSDMIGWAFDINGHNATNTVFEYEDATKVYKGKLIDISISGSNTPGNAAVIETESDYVYTPNHSVQGIKHQYIWGSTGRFFRSFYQSFEENTPPEECHGPVYSFYDGDKKIVIRQNYFELTNDFVDTRPGSRDFGCSLYEVSVELGVPNTNTTYEYGNSSFNSRFWYSIDGYERQLNVPPKVQTSRPAVVTSTWYQLGGWTGANDSGTLGIASEHWRLVDTYTSYTSESAGYNLESLIIPFNSRTAFYIWQSRSYTNAIYANKSSWTSAWAKGTFYRKDLYSEAFWISSEDDPCNCAPAYPAAGYHMGIWTNPDYSPTSLTDYVPTDLGTPALKDPKPDSNHSDGRLVACWEQGRAECSPKDVNGCKWTDDYSGGGCGARETETATLIEPAQDGYHKCNLYFGGEVREVVNFDGYQEHFWETGAWWNQVLNTPQEDGYQYLFVTADAFTGAGWASGDIYQPIFADSFVVMNNANDVYPMGDISLRANGFFGVPFPERLL